MNAFSNIFRISQLRNRILFTLAMLAVYRFGIFITPPGVNRAAMRTFMSDADGILGMFSLFSGGALENFSIFSLNIMPYVSASIILQLMGVVVKPLEELRKEGEAGQRKINRYTRYGTVLLALFQSSGTVLWLETLTTSEGANVVPQPGWTFRIIAILALTTGTAFLMWLGEQITERGIGNGISIIIFAGIVAGLPSALMNTGALVQGDQLQPIDILVIGAVALGVTAFIVYFERAQRRLPVQYAKRMVGSQVFGGQSSHLPLKVNMAGVIPPIITSSLLMFPLTIQNWASDGSGLQGAMQWIGDALSPNGANQWIYLTVFAVLTIFFCFFYTAVTFQPVEVADGLKKQNAFIPGIRPGKATADYIDRVVSRLTTAGALYIAAVCTVPTLLQSEYGVPFYLGGTSLMIVVGVALDVAQQIESYVIERRYEGLTSGAGSKLSGRRA